MAGRTDHTAARRAGGLAHTVAESVGDRAAVFDSVAAVVGMADRPEESAGAEIPTGDLAGVPVPCRGQQAWTGDSIPANRRAAALAELSHNQFSPHRAERDSPEGPRSDRKKRFLLSAVAPSTVTRHPRKAKPINWAQRGGLASGGKLPSDAEATFHGAIMHAWLPTGCCFDGPPFRRRAVRLVNAEAPISGFIPWSQIWSVSRRS